MELSKPLIHFMVAERVLPTARRRSRFGRRSRGARISIFVKQIATILLTVS